MRFLKNLLKCAGSSNPKLWAISETFYTIEMPDFFFQIIRHLVELSTVDVFDCLHFFHN